MPIRVYNSEYSNGLQNAEKVPNVHGWLSYGTSLLLGAKFVAAVSLRAGVLPTRLMLSHNVRLSALLTFFSVAVEHQGQGLSSMIGLFSH